MRFLVRSERQTTGRLRGRFENLDLDFAFVSRRIGVSARLPKLNASVPRPDYRKFYSDCTAELIGRKYAEDIERFGYDFDPSSIRSSVA